ASSEEPGFPQSSYDTKENIFFPPLIGRYVRLHPLHSYNYPTVRLEYCGCELDGCSVPLGMESGLIKDAQITASSLAFSWYPGQWHPWYARLNKHGTINAWKAKKPLKVFDKKKIRGHELGNEMLGNEMFVTAYTLEYSEDGKRWTKYTDDENCDQKVSGNTDNYGQVKNYIYPPIFSRFIRISPKQWQKSITMRVELLGCDFE
uniref:F5/8 type C domain-containing protein n=1 Tax=Sinocyclocheilus anshuiensis TaxID=1608454 RepID=A0A671P0L7_9TELE